jgi:hypothetical protein
MSCKKGFFLWDIGITLVLIACTSVLVSIWYMHLVTFQQNLITRLRAVMLGSSIIERCYATRTISIGSYRLDRFLITIKPHEHTNGLVVWYSVSVEWLEKKQPQHIQFILAKPR